MMGVLPPAVLVATAGVALKVSAESTDTRRTLLHAGVGLAVAALLAASAYVGVEVGAYLTALPRVYTS